MKTQVLFKAGGMDRRNLTIKVSQDLGQSWSLGRAIEPGKASYSDLAVTPDKRILCIYGCSDYHNTILREQGQLCDVSLALASFTRDWVQRG